MTQLVQPQIKYKLNHPLCGDVILESYKELCEYAISVGEDEARMRLNDQFVHMACEIADEIIVSAYELQAE